MYINYKIDNVLFSNADIVQKSDEQKSDEQKSDENNDYLFKQYYQYKIISEANKECKLDYLNFKLFWDYKTKLFKINYKNDNKNKLNEVAIKVNNQYRYTNSNTKIINSVDNKDVEFISHSMFNKFIPFQDIKIISILFTFSNNKKREIIINIKNHNNYKNDFEIDNFSNNLILKCQTGIAIDQQNNIKDIFSSTSFEVIPINQGFHNFNLININQKYDNVPFNRNEINVKKISNLPIKKNKFQDFDIETLEEKGIYKITFNKNTYYDLNERETIIGFSENSQIGYVLPYDYSGIFYPYITLDLNLYTNIKVAWKNQFDKPYYFKNIGKIKVNISDNNDIVDSLEWNKINYKLLKESEEYKFVSYDEFINWLKEKNNE